MAAQTGKTTVNLNLRAGPGTQFAVLTVLPPGTPLAVLADGPDGQADWLRVKALGQTGCVHKGFVILSGQGVPDGFLGAAPTPAELDSLPLAPAVDQQIRLPAQSSGPERQAAATWNRYGELLRTLSARLRLDPAAAVAVLAVSVTVMRMRAPTDASAADLQALIQQSQQIEEALRAYDPTSRVLNGRAASAVAELEDRIALVDMGLSEAQNRGAARDELMDLWRQRLQLMDELVRVHVTRAAYVGL